MNQHIRSSSSNEKVYKAFDLTCNFQDTFSFPLLKRAYPVVQTDFEIPAVKRLQCLVRLPSIKDLNILPNPSSTFSQQNVLISMQQNHNSPRLTNQSFVIEEARFSEGQQLPNSKSYLFVSEGAGERRTRWRVTEEQLSALKELNKKSFYPSTQQRNNIAKRLGLSTRTVQIWFQNRRKEFKNIHRKSPPKDNLFSDQFN